MKEYGLWCYDYDVSRWRPGVSPFGTVWLTGIGPQPLVASWSADADRALRFTTVQEAHAARERYWANMGGKFTAVVGVLPA